MKAGSIRPEIVTTVATITGAAVAEVYKFAQSFSDLTRFRDCIVNLASPNFLFIEPEAVKTKKSSEFDPQFFGPVKAIPEGFTIYDKVVIKEGSLTFSQLFEWFKDKFGVNV